MGLYHYIFDLYQNRFSHSVGGLNKDVFLIWLRIILVFSFWINTAQITGTIFISGKDGFNNCIMILFLDMNSFYHCIWLFPLDKDGFSNFSMETYKQPTYITMWLTLIGQTLIITIAMKIICQCYQLRQIPKRLLLREISHAQDQYTFTVSVTR